MIAERRGGHRGSTGVAIRHKTGQPEPGALGPAQFRTRFMPGQHLVKESTELSHTRRYSCDHGSGSHTAKVREPTAAAVFDAEEVRRSDLLAPTNQPLTLSIRRRPTTAFPTPRCDCGSRFGDRVVMAGGHRAGLTESHASDKAGDAARMGTEIPSKREGSRSGSGSGAFRYPRTQRRNPQRPKPRRSGGSGESANGRDTLGLVASGTNSETPMQHLVLTWLR